MKINAGAPLVATKAVFVESAPLVQLVDAAATEKAVDASSLPCSACEVIISFIDQFLAANPNATEADIEGALDMVCNLLPGAYKTSCDNFVAAEVPNLLKYVTLYTPQQLCAAVGLCSSANLAQQNVPAQIVNAVAAVEDDSNQCKICKTVMIFAQSWLEAHKNETEAQLQAVAEKFCTALPSPYNATCEIIVTTQLPALFNKLLSETPDQLCQQIKLCTSLNALNAIVSSDAALVAAAAHSAQAVASLTLPLQGNVDEAFGRVVVQKTGLVKLN